MVTARDLFVGRDLYFAELTCLPEDSEWCETNQVTRPIVALPATPVWQAHDGAPPALMNPTHAVLHGPGTEYRRERFRGNGYRCLFFFPSEQLVREIVAETEPSAGEHESCRFPSRTAPLPAATFALARRLARELGTEAAASGPVPADRFRVREGLYAILRAAVLSSYRTGGAARRQRSATASAHRDLVEAAKELITGHLGDRIRLDDVADRLHVSAYHLARVFRATTGYSLHAYLTHLRLREGLDRLERGQQGDIARLGLDLGFSSHSHFTSSFRRAMGTRPSEVALAAS